MRTFLVSVGFLTCIPVHINARVDDQMMSRSMIFFPLVGGIIGALNVGAYFALYHFLPLTVISVILIAFPIIITGGLHFDGLMDACDGLFSGRPREQMLEIMRDSRVGSMGVIAGIINVLLRFSALTALPSGALPGVLVVMAVGSRWVMSLALHFFPYARKEGKGMAFNSQKRIINIILSSLWTVGIIFLIHRTAGLLSLLAVGALSMGLACWAAKKLGGLTGDVYGALNEAAEILFLLLALLEI